MYGIAVIKHPGMIIIGGLTGDGGFNTNKGIWPGRHRIIAGIGDDGPGVEEALDRIKVTLGAIVANPIGYH